MLDRAILSAPLKSAFLLPRSQERPEPLEKNTKNEFLAIYHRPGQRCSTFNILDIEPDIRILNKIGNDSSMTADYCPTKRCLTFLIFAIHISLVLRQ